MYNESIKCENKIITSEDLAQIFQLMGETLKKYKKISEREEQQNNTRELAYRNYTFKDEGSKMKVIVDFYDDTNITFDNYESFMSIFYSRIAEIKTMDVYYKLDYTTMTPEPNRSRNYYSQSIKMYIKDNKMEITLNLKSEDPKLDEIYIFIKNKILNAPEKYDEVIRNRNKITNISALALGLVPGIIISTLLLFIPVLNMLFFKSYIIYPICTLFLAYLIGSVLSSLKLDKYYTTIEPSKKNTGFDSNYKRIYEDDIDSFVGTSEILIGRKVNNIENRKIILAEYEKYKKYLPKELIVLITITLIVIIVGFFV